MLEDGSLKRPCLRDGGSFAVMAACFRFICVAVTTAVDDNKSLNFRNVLEHSTRWQVIENDGM